MTLPTPTRVSVIVPTRNRADLLRESLASIRALEGPDLALEIIVADNGSTDATEAVAGAFGARLVRTLTPGAAAARNAGLRAATGDYIAFLDDDDVWLPGHLRPHLRLLAARPELAAVVGQVQNSDQALTGHGSPWPESLPTDGDLFVSFLRYCPQLGATVVRATVRETVGYLDEELLSDEDWDWHLRLALQHPVGFVAKPCILFRQRPMGTHDDLEWQRLAFFRRVLVRNVRRYGRPLSLAFIVRAYLAGGFYQYFATSALVHAEAGDRRAAGTCVQRALCASPLHAVRDLVRGGELRAALGKILGASARGSIQNAPLR